jgi:hypothetical protein
MPGIPAGIPRGASASVLLTHAGPKQSRDREGAVKAVRKRETRVTYPG